MFPFYFEVIKATSNYDTIRTESPFISLPTPLSGHANNRIDGIKEERAHYKVRFSGQSEFHRLTGWKEPRGPSSPMPYTNAKDARLDPYAHLMVPCHGALTLMQRIHSWKVISTAE